MANKRYSFSWANGRTGHKFPDLIPRRFNDFPDFPQNSRHVMVRPADYKCLLSFQSSEPRAPPVTSSRMSTGSI